MSTSRLISWSRVSLDNKHPLHEALSSTTYATQTIPPSIANTYCHLINITDHLHFYQLRLYWYSVLERGSELNCNHFMSLVPIGRDGQQVENDNG